MDYRTVKQIEQLIKDGFDLDLIAFELDISMEFLKKCEKQIQANKNATSKMDQLREKYYELYYTSNKTIINDAMNLTEQQIELIESVIQNVEETIGKMGNISKTERRKFTRDILQEARKIEMLQLTVEQTQNLLTLLNSTKLNKVNVGFTDQTDTYVLKVRKKFTKTLIEAIDIAQSKTADLDELKMLQRKITTEIEKENLILAKTVRDRIGNRIMEIQKQNAIERIKNDVSKDIEQIIRKLASGELDDIEEANKVIEEETKRRFENKTRNKFSLTEEQEKNQVIIQIKKCLREQAEVYPIENPEITIQQLTDLIGGNFADVINIVGENCIRNKQFEKAKEICDKYKEKRDDVPEKSYIKRLRDDIKKAEIADIILKGINKRGTVQEENRTFELIEEGLNRANMKLGAITLGKNQDGTKSITLADIWESEQIR